MVWAPSAHALNLPTGITTPCRPRVATPVSGTADVGTTDDAGYRRRMTVTTRPKICTWSAANTIGDRRGLAGIRETEAPLR